MYQLKSGGEIKDVDVKRRIVSGYFSIFNNIDADKDKISPGAYKKSISENTRIKHLYQHDPRMPLSAVRGGTLKLKEDATGLYFESKIADTSVGRDVIKLYDDGVIDEHSVGIVVSKSFQRADYRELKELRLIEGSTVTWGSNEKALITSIKLDAMVKCLKDGRYENEEVFDFLEIYVAQQKETQEGEQKKIDYAGIFRDFTATLK